MTAPKPILTRDQILHMDDVKREKTFIPEWNGEMYVRGMTARERSELESDILGAKTTEESRAVMARSKLKIAAWCSVDSRGNRLFDDEEDKDGEVVRTAVEILGEKNASAVERIFGVAMRLSKMSEEDLKAQVKNSSGTPSEDSSSDSASPSEESDASIPTDSSGS